MLNYVRLIIYTKKICGIACRRFFNPARSFSAPYCSPHCSSKPQNNYLNKSILYFSVCKDYFQKLSPLSSNSIIYL